MKITNFQGFSYITYINWRKQKVIEPQAKSTELSCPLCNLVIKSGKIGNLNRHLKLHNKVQEIFICNLCSQQFPTKFNLQKHCERHKNLPNDALTYRVEKRAATERPIYNKTMWCLGGFEIFCIRLIKKKINSLAIQTLPTRCRICSHNNNNNNNWCVH